MRIRGCTSSCCINYIVASAYTLTSYILHNMFQMLTYSILVFSCERHV